MSDYAIIFIPTDPQLVPDQAAQVRAKEWARATFPQANTVSSASSDEVEFIDQGENFEAVYCPLCSSKLDIEWWQDTMGAACESQFSDLSVTMPCCGAQSSLNDLRYVLPAGFARYILEVNEPNVDEVDQGLVSALEAIIAHPVRVIYRSI